MEPRVKESRIEEIKKRLKRASPGPWSNAGTDSIYIGATNVSPGVTKFVLQLGDMEMDCDQPSIQLAISQEIRDEHFYNSAEYDEDEDWSENDYEVFEAQSLANAELVANAPQDIADLIAYIEHLEKEMLINQTT